MKPDWDDLGEKFENSKKVVIGDVDCTEEINKQLCEDQGVKGYPTIKYYTPGDRDGQVYEGERDKATLMKFAKSLGPPCSGQHPKRCTKEERVKLDEYMALPEEELQTKLSEAAEQLKTTQETHDALLKSLQSQFEESDKKLKALKESLEPEIKVMKGAMLKPEKKAKDEV
jgi:hypothetical protein